MINPKTRAGIIKYHKKANIHPEARFEPYLCNILVARIAKDVVDIQQFCT